MALIVFYKWQNAPLERILSLILVLTAEIVDRHFEIIYSLCQR